MNFDNDLELDTVFTRIRNLYPDIKITKADIDIEELEDEYLLSLASEREKNDNGVSWSFEEVLAEDGLTIEDIENMEDVEIE